MTNKVYSCSFTGLQCRTIEVQADISNGMPSFSIVGLGDTSVQESKERVRSSIKNSGAYFPQTKKTINLAPAQVRKQGSAFDFPIAAGILLADQQIFPEKIQNSIIIGELSLTGKVKRVNGILPITQHAKEQGFFRIFIPKENALEASFIDGIEIYPIDSLKQFMKFCIGETNIKPCPHRAIENFQRKNTKTYSLTSIVGLEKAKRALAISAAGGHNALLFGSPGCGKTVLCRAFKSLLPQMNSKEIIETTKIFSIAGFLDSENPLVVERPFREVHHTASTAAVVGGGAHPRPGEISLAHNGVLFLDEIAEFKRTALESLRQPLEDKVITINRATTTLKFPSNFILLATMNPCPCGYKGDHKIKCICTENQVKNYQKRLSGPLLDRFDIFIEIAKTPMEKIFAKKTYAQETSILNAIKTAQKKQNERFQNAPHIHKNADMSLDEIKIFCQIDPESKALLKQAAKNLQLSNRGYLKILKTARTIADMEGQPQIQSQHIAEAIQYRRR